MIDPAQIQALGGPDQDVTDRRRALARMLMTPNAPMEAYRTPQGSALGMGTQVLQGLGQNPQFMKWLSGAFGPGDGKGPAGAIPMDPMTGRAIGPV
jgi:hypothetical protein